MNDCKNENEHIRFVLSYFFVCVPTYVRTVQYVPSRYAERVRLRRNVLYILVYKPL